MKSNIQHSQQKIRIDLIQSGDQIVNVLYQKENNTSQLKISIKEILYKISGNTRKLIMENNQISPAGIHYFSTIRLTNLIELSLFSNKIGPNGCKYLTRAFFPNLQVLFLGHNNIGKQGVLHLCKGEWRALNQIILPNENIGFDGVRRLTKGNWKILCKIFISLNGLTETDMIDSVLLQSKLITEVHLCN